MTSRHLRTLALTLVFIACAAPPERMAPDDVIYEAGATDEAWLTIDDATPMVSDTLAPQLTAPTGAISRTAAPLTFTWSPGIVDATVSLPRAPRNDPFERAMRELFR